MRRSITRFLSTCIFLSAPFFTNGQEIGSADSLFEARDYLGARVGYERLLFQGRPDANMLLLKKSFCLKAEGKFDEAYNTLKRADLFNGNDSVNVLVYNELVMEAYMDGKFDLVLSTLQELNYYFPDKATTLSDALEILALNQLLKWDEAEKKFVSFQTKYDLPDKHLYQDRPKIKNPGKAETLSYLIPGSGQLYAGYPGRALTSLLIQGGLITFAVYSFAHGYYLSGAFTGVGLFYFFYNGGASHAKDLAVKYNSEQLAGFNEGVKFELAKAGKK